MSTPSNDEARFLALEQQLSERRGPAPAARSPEERPQTAREVLEAFTRPDPSALAAIRARREKWEAETIARIEAEARTPEAETRWLISLGVPRRLAECAPKPTSIPTALREWRPRRGAGSALLSGESGTGKSTAAIWALRQVYRRGAASTQGWTCPSAAWITALDLTQLAFDSLDSERRASAAKRMRALRSCEVLVVDDFGAAHDSPFPAAAMDGLFDHRWGERLCTIVTTNLPPHLMAESYMRIDSRLRDREGPGLVMMRGRDRRQG